MQKLVSFFLLIFMMFSLVACKGEEKSSEDEFKVVTSFYPVYVTTLNVIDGVENVSIVNMTEPDIGCLHDYIMTSDDIEKATGANLFIASGLNMEKFVGKVSLGIPRLELLESGEDIPFVIGEEEEENPHYWMNIENTIAQTEKIKRTLCRLDPENSEAYEKNALEYTKKLKALQKEAKSRCASLKKREIAVFHDSFDYFAEEFGIDIIPVLPEEGNALAKSRIKRNGIDTIFVQESLSDDKILRKVSEETECELALLDTVTTGKKAEPAKDAYINAILKNLDLLEAVLNK